MKNIRLSSISAKAIAAVAIAVGFSACSSDEPTFVATQDNSGAAINFSLRTTNMSRANLETEHTDFGVWAYKTTDTDIEVMKNFQVKYDASSTPTWNYVGVNSQAQKYFDPASTKTLFYACTPYSSTNSLDVTGANPVLTMDQWTMTKNTTDGMATAPLYAYSEVAKSNYNNSVSLSFKRAHAQVGISFVESVPGYKVKIVTLGKNTVTDTEYNEGVYAQPVIANTESGATSHIKTDATYTSKGTPVVTFSPTPSLSYNYGAGTTSNALLTFAAPSTDVDGNTTAVASDDVYYMVPANSEAANCALYFHISFQLINKANEADIITFRNVKVLVPATYTAWEANKKYTYKFDIKDSFKGGTSEPDPNDPTIDDDQALQPIVFAGVEIEDITSANTTETSISVQ